MEPEIFWSGMAIGAICDVSWLVAYVLLIRRNFQDKACGMPMVALCGNLSWETMCAFIHLTDPSIFTDTEHFHVNHIYQVYFCVLWLLVDFVILYQFLKFGKQHFQKMDDRFFQPVFWSTLAITFFTFFCFDYEFRNWGGNYYENYTGFGHNLLMSVLFIWMLLERQNLDGQSIYIALFKGIGSLTAGIAVHLLFPPSLFLDYLYFVILLFDIVYIVMVYRKSQEMGISPWQRV